MDWWRLTYRSGPLVWTPIAELWQAPKTLDAADPPIPSLPLLSLAVGGDHTLTVSGVQNTSTFGTVAANATFAPTGFANTQAFGAQAVNGTLGAIGFASTSAFGIVAVNGTLAPSGILNVSHFGAAAFQPAPVEALPPPSSGGGRVWLRERRMRFAGGIPSATCFGVAKITPDAMDPDERVFFEEIIFVMALAA